MFHIKYKFKEGEDQRKTTAFGNLKRKTRWQEDFAEASDAVIEEAKMPDTNTKKIPESENNISEELVSEPSNSCGKNACGKL